MTTHRAVVWADPRSATVLQLDEQHTPVRTVRTHPHPTAQHGSAVRTEHEFFGEVCDELGRFDQILVAGSHTAPADLRHYAGKHRPQTAACIVGYEIADHPHRQPAGGVGTQVLRGARPHVGVVTSSARA